MIALQSLAATSHPKDEAVAPFLKNDSALVRALAARILPVGLIDLKAIAGSDASPLVRAEAIRRLADPAASDVLLKALELDDPFLRQAARQGLRRSLKFDELLARAATTNLTHGQRLGLLLILRDLARPEASALVPGFLSDPDPLIRFAAIQWVGEHRLVQFRPQLLAGLATSAGTRSLFEATLAALDQLDGKQRNPRDEVAGEDYIAALLNDPRTSAPVLERGLRMLRPSHPALTLDRLRRFVTGNALGVAIEAVRTLCQNPSPARFAVLSKLATDRSASLPLRAEAIVGLADDASNQRQTLLALATGERPELRREALRGLRGVALTDQEKSALRASGRGDAVALELVDSLASGGRSITAKPGQGRPPAADLNAWLGRLEGPADPAAGERVFFHSKGPGCFHCHQVNGRGGRAGPDLSTLATGMDRRRLIESILTPSKEIAPQFVAWSIARTNGTVFTGILLEQTPEGSLVFADSQGRPTAVKASEIAERKPQTASIMPDSLIQTMPVQDFRDLIAFLWQRR